MQKQAKELQLHHQQQQIGRAVARSRDLRQRPDTESPLLAQAGGKRRRGAAAQLRYAHLAYGEGGNVLSLHNPDPVRSRRCAPDNGVMRKVRATRKLYATTRWTPTRPLRAWMLNFLPIQMIAIGNAGRDFHCFSPYHQCSRDRGLMAWLSGPRVSVLRCKNGG